MEQSGFGHSSYTVVIVRPTGATAHPTSRLLLHARHASPAGNAPPTTYNWRVDFPGMASEAGLSTTDLVAAFALIDTSGEHTPSASRRLGLARKGADAVSKQYRKLVSINMR